METDDEAPACLIMEACLMNMSIVPPGPGCLEKVREITKRHGIVLIFDELNSYLMEGCTEVAHDKAACDAYIEAFARMAHDVTE